MWLTSCYALVTVEHKGLTSLDRNIAHSLRMCDLFIVYLLAFTAVLTCVCFTSSFWLLTVNLYKPRFVDMFNLSAKIKVHKKFQAKNSPNCPYNYVCKHVQLLVYVKFINYNP